MGMDLGLKAATLAESPMQESTKQRLEREKHYLQERIDDINEALALLEKYPDMERLTDLLRRI